MEASPTMKSQSASIGTSSFPDFIEDNVKNEKLVKFLEENPSVKDFILIFLGNMEVSMQYDWDLGKDKIKGDLSGLSLPCRKPSARLLQLQAISILNFTDKSTIYQHTCGTYFAIVNCGLPTTESNCPKCKGKMGGLDHKLHAGTTKVCLVTTAPTLIAQEKGAFKIGYTDHEVECRPDWALLIWPEYGCHLNIYFAHMLTHLALLYRELNQPLIDTPKLQKMLEHALFDIRIIVESVKMDSLTVSHWLSNIAFGLFDKISKGEVKDFTEFIIKHSNSLFQNFEQTLTEFSQKKMNVDNQNCVQRDYLVKWIKSLLFPNEGEEKFTKEVFHQLKLFSTLGNNPPLISTS